MRNINYALSLLLFFGTQNNYYQYILIFVIFPCKKKKKYLTLVMKKCNAVKFFPVYLIIRNIFLFC